MARTARTTASAVGAVTCLVIVPAHSSCARSAGAVVGGNLWLHVRTVSQSTPTGGTETLVNNFRTALEPWVRQGKRVTVHTVGFSPDHDYEFLNQLRTVGTSDVRQEMWRRFAFLLVLVLLATSPLSLCVCHRIKPVLNAPPMVPCNAVSWCFPLGRVSSGTRPLGPTVTSWPASCEASRTLCCPTHP